MRWLRWRPSTTMVGAVCLSLCLLLPTGSWAQGMPEEVLVESKIVATTGASFDTFGSAVAVSGDILVATARTAAVDGRFAAGAAYVFVRDPNGEWVEHKRLVPQDSRASDQFGVNVAIAGDTIVVGAPFARIGAAFQQGAVYLFERNAGGADNWGEVAKLTDDAVGAIGNFGSSVAIASNLLAVGAIRGGGDGQVTIYERDRDGAAGWSKVTTLYDGVVGDGGSFESFGSAVAISGDLLLVGAATADVSYFGQNDGAAYLFRRDQADPDRWNFVSRLTAAEAKLCPGDRTLAEIASETPEVGAEVERCAQEDSRTDLDNFGTTVALEGDIVVIGASRAESAGGGPAVGAAYVYRQDAAGADQWSQIAKLTGSDVLASAFPSFGSALTLAGDTLIVGASGAIGPLGVQGAVYVFKRAAGGPDLWGETAKFVAADGVTGDRFGAAAALDGPTRIIGATGHDTSRGAVYLATDPLPAEPPAPAFPPNGELVADSIVEGPGGALLGTVGTPLAEPLPVWIHEVPAPAEPLSATTTPVGPFYNVGAVPTTSAPNEQPFGLALPVPEGVDHGHLAAAILVPAVRLIEGSDPADPWMPVLGFYDPETGLFSIVLHDLFIEGSTVVLIEQPDLAPLSVVEETALKASADELTFDVRCHGFFLEPGECNSEDETKLESYLKAAYDKYVAIGYEEPALLKHGARVRFTLEGLRIFEQFRSPEYYGNLIVDAEDRDCDPEDLAQYRADRRIIIFCYLRGEHDEPTMERVARHEMFHAFQHDAPLFHDDYINTSAVNAAEVEDLNWISEGTAAVAEDSSAQEMNRGNIVNRPLHPIYTALTASDYKHGVASEQIAYLAQDFWVYFGRKKGLGLDYLRLLFDRGANPEAADAFFRELHQTSLADEYWGWVKNQAMERTIDLDATTPDGCDIDVARDLPVIGEFQVLPYPHVEINRPLEGALPRLTAEVVMINIIADVGPTTITVGEPAEGLAYKIYRDGELGCESVDDNRERRFDALKADQDDIYVVLANTNREVGNWVGYTLQVMPTPAP